MISTFYEKHKKICLVAAGIFSFILISFYLYAVFQPGYWYFDAFLCKQKDGSFAGSDSYGSYQMEIKRADDSATIIFSVDDLTKEYLITGTATGENVYIYEDEDLVFHGYSLKIDGSQYMLMGYDNYDTNNIISFASNIKPAPEELLPSYSFLYACAKSDTTDTHGEPTALILICIFIAVLVLDIKFPDLFFTLRYRHYVVGGEPSDWYRDSQKVGRVILVVAIFVFVILTFQPH